MIELSLILLTVYITLIIVFSIGWKRIPTFELMDEKPFTPSITVVIACKNEANNLPNLLQLLIQQSITGFQLILVDDHSTDNTYQIMLQASIKFNNLLVLRSDGKGKKAALKTGVEQATNELIITTDADCSPPFRWLETFNIFWEENNSDLIIGPVAISPVKGLLEKMQQLEFLSLVSSGAGAHGTGKPFMCNGANLAFKRDLWLQNYVNLQEKSDSGDDVFLLHAIKKQKAKIEFLKLKEAIVTTKPCHTIQSFIEQRKRWASKAPLYTDTTTILVAIIVFSISLSQVTLFVASFISAKYILFFCISFFSKLFIDTYFILHTAPFFGQKITTKTLIALAVTYPFYIVYTAISGVLKTTKLSV